MNARAHAAARHLEASLPDWKRAYRIDEAAAATGLGKSTLWKRIAEGRLATRKDGNCTLILRDELERFLHALPEEIKPPREGGQ